MRFRPIVLFPLLFLACDDPTGPSSYALPPVDVSWTSGQSVVCFGTSLTYGYLGWFEEPVGFRFHQPPVIPSVPAKGAGIAEADTHSYPYHLGLRIRLPVYNEGIVGETAQGALGELDSVLARDPALVLLEFGANEFLREHQVIDVEPPLRRLIDTLRSTGAVVVLVSFINNEMITGLPADHYMTPRIPLARAYLGMLRGIAAEEGILFVEWTMRGIYWNDDLLSDGIHPNRAGYRIMAENVYAALEPTFARNGMKR